MPSIKNRRCIVIERGSIFLTASVCSYERFGSIALLSYRYLSFLSGDLEISRRRVSFQTKRATPQQTHQHTNTPTPNSTPTNQPTIRSTTITALTTSTAITSSTPNGQHNSEWWSILSKKVRCIRLYNMARQTDICLLYTSPSPRD